MEQFDILDAQGRATGLVADKGAALHSGQFFLGVHAYICNAARQFLVQRRAFTKSFRPGAWDIHMGHVMAGETSLACMRREVYEEIGLDIAPENVRACYRSHWGAALHTITDLYFIEREFDIRALALQQDEVIAVRAIDGTAMLHMVAAMADYRSTAYVTLVRRGIGALLEGVVGPQSYGLR